MTAAFAGDEEFLRAEIAWLEAALNVLMMGSEPEEGTLADLRQEIQQRLAVDPGQASSLMLPRLASVFGLSAAEELALVACFAPEVEPRFAALYSQVPGLARLPYPSTALTARLARLDPR